MATSLNERETSPTASVRERFWNLPDARLWPDVMYCHDERGITGAAHQSQRIRHDANSPSATVATRPGAGYVAAQGSLVPHYLNQLLIFWYHYLWYWAHVQKLGPRASVECLYSGVNVHDPAPIYHYSVNYWEAGHLSLRMGERQRRIHQRVALVGR